MVEGEAVAGIGFAYLWEGERAGVWEECNEWKVAEDTGKEGRR